MAWWDFLFTTHGRNMTGYCDRDAAGKLTGKEFWG
jgi:hypothetical protein